MRIKIDLQKIFSLLVLFVLILASGSSHQVQPGVYDSHYHILSLEGSSQPPTRLGTYWLNFSFDDNNHIPFAIMGFQFLVDGNKTGFWAGFANTQPIIEQPSVNYVDFANASHLFVSYTFNNGSQLHSIHNFAGPPFYGPPGYNYGPFGLNGFPYVSGGEIWSWNSTPYSDLYKSWSYWFTASNLVVVPTSTQLGNQTLRDLSIVVNMSVSMVRDNASEWAFQPNVQISGEKFTESTTGDSSFLAVQTGIQLSPSFWTPLKISIVAAALIVIGGLSTIYLVKKRMKYT